MRDYEILYFLKKAILIGRGPLEIVVLAGMLHKLNSYNIEGKTIRGSMSVQ